MAKATRATTTGARTRPAAGSRGIANAPANLATETSNRQALADLIGLRDALEQAFDGAMEIGDMRRIARAMSAVTGEILRVNGLEIARMGETYAPGFADLETAIEDLKQIRENIRQISSSVRTIGEVVSAIAKVAEFIPFI